jgi:DNA-directed RNA polymerase specialized sigma24 family protein
MYIENDELYKNIIAYSEAYQKYQNGEIAEKPHIPEKLGQMIYLIAQNLAKKGNFSGYTWKEDMIQDGCLACLLYIHNYKKEYLNAFGYVTAIIARAFINHIKKQKRHSYIKNILANSQLEINALIDETGNIDYQEIRKLVGEIDA